jgi:phosphoribosylaminoimidazole (AIR) synthetase
MYRVFNMGIGFCLILADEPSLISAVRQTFEASGFETHVIGKVIADEQKRIFLPKQGLVGEGEEFRGS